MTTLEAINRYYGDLNRWPIEPDGINATQAQIIAVCEYIARTGECLWHAQAVVLQTAPCHCAACQDSTIKGN